MTQATTRDAAPATQARTRGANPWGVLAIILTAVFMQLLDTTITMVGVPSIQNSLHSSFGEIQLVVAGYMLAFACVLVLGGRLGDTYGRKRMFLWGMAGFTLASAVCGAAPDALTLIISRVVQGMASGLMFPQVLGIIQVVFRKDQRTRAIGFYGATIGLATILGPVTGGGLIDLNIVGWGWRSIFFVNVPIGIVALALGAAMIPESRSSLTSRIDVPGAALLGAGLFLLVLPLVIGRDEGWPTWSFGCIAVSPFVLAAFSAYERNRTRRDGTPLIDTTLFRQRPFTLGLIAPVTNVVLAGISSRDAGSASGALATAQQVGAALGIAVAGVIFFGLLGVNANTSSAGALPQLRHELTVAGMPAAEQQLITGRFQACFSARAHATDPSSTPAICAQTMRESADSPAPAPVEAA